jgi:D-alanine-D-alanine ligase
LPVNDPDPTKDNEWSFLDTERGILDAIGAGANVLWANVTLHSAHPLVHLQLAGKIPSSVRLVGQDPGDTERYEDKGWVNRWLDSKELEGKFPKSWLVHKGEVERLSKEVELPSVLKPIRGRGSYGVSLVKSREELLETAGRLWEEGDAIVIEVGAWAGVSMFALADP